MVSRSLNEFLGRRTKESRVRFNFVKRFNDLNDLHTSQLYYRVSGKEGNIILLFNTLQQLWKEFEIDTWEKEFTKRYEWKMDETIPEVFEVGLDIIVIPFLTISYRNSSRKKKSHYLFLIVLYLLMVLINLKISIFVCRYSLSTVWCKLDGGI